MTTPFIFRHVTLLFYTWFWVKVHLSFLFYNNYYKIMSTSLNYKCKACLWLKLFLMIMFSINKFYWVLKQMQNTSKSNCMWFLFSWIVPSFALTIVCWLHSGKSFRYITQILLFVTVEIFLLRVRKYPVRCSWIAICLIKLELWNISSFFCLFSTNLFSF